MDRTIVLLVEKTVLILGKALDWAEGHLREVTIKAGSTEYHIYNPKDLLTCHWEWYFYTV